MTFKQSNNWMIFNQFRFISNSFYMRKLVIADLKQVKFIYSEKPQHFAKSSPYFWLALHRTKVRWRFRKILGPSQNIWTLSEKKISQTYFPILRLRAAKRFWSILKIVNFGRSPIESGKNSIEFWLKCKSVKFLNPLIS